MDAESFRKYGYQVVDWIVDYYQALQDNKYPIRAQVPPGYLQNLVPK